MYPKKIYSKLSIDLFNTIVVAYFKNTNINQSFSPYHFKILYDKYIMPEKETIDTLLDRHYMFSDTLDLKRIRLYLSIGYSLIFKYKNSFCVLTFIDFPNSIHFNNLDFRFFKICNKQDIKNYFYFIRNRDYKLCNKGFQMFKSDLDSSIFK